MPSTVTINISAPINSNNPPPSTPPRVTRTFDVTGSITARGATTNHSRISCTVTVQFGSGGPVVSADVDDDYLTWECRGAPPESVEPDRIITVTIRTRVGFEYPLQGGGGEMGQEGIEQQRSFEVRLPARIPPNLTFASYPSPIRASQLPLSFTFSGTASGVQRPVSRVQYAVEGSPYFDAQNPAGNWSQWSVTLPLPPGERTITLKATDGYGTSTPLLEKTFNVQPQIPLPQNTSSVTSWTRLEPQSDQADIGTSSSARLFDPLWLITRQWQMGEFQAEDAGTPVKARVRATTAPISRCHFGNTPQGPVQGRAYDPAQTPLEVIVARRRMRAADANDARMLTFAVEAGLHFLRMLEQQSLSQSYRAAFLTKLALQSFGASMDEATRRFVQTMQGRAPDARRLASILRIPGGAGQLVQDPTLNIAAADRPKLQQVANAWLAWYDSVYSEPAGATDDAWNPSRLEYSMSVGARLSDDLAFSATEFDGSALEWSSFDLNTQASLGTDSDAGATALVEATVPSPITFRGAPVPRFWELEDAHVAYGLVPVGPTDLAHLMMIEYASTYGNDWFVVPLTIPVGSVTRVSSLVITDSFGVRSLLRPIGDPALPAPYFSMWQPALLRTAGAAPAGSASNLFFFPSTLSRTIDGPPVEDVLFMRDEMANMAWAIERSVENPIEQAAQRYDASETTPPEPVSAEALPRYVLSSTVPPNWIPLLPVRMTNGSNRLQRGAVLQPDGSQIIHRAAGEVLNAAAQLLLFDEEVPRQGVNVTRQRRLTRWMDGSTWLWTSLRNQSGQGEGASTLRFDQVI